MSIRVVKKFYTQWCHDHHQSPTQSSHVVPLLVTWIQQWLHEWTLAFQRYTHDTHRVRVTTHALQYVASAFKITIPFRHAIVAALAQRAGSRSPSLFFQTMLRQTFRAHHVSVTFPVLVGMDALLRGALDQLLTQTQPDTRLRDIVFGHARPLPSTPYLLI